MLAQMTMDAKSNNYTESFKETTEKPLLKGFLLFILGGTLLGGLVTDILMQGTVSTATLMGADLAGAAFGASAGLLMFGLGDVIFAGRLEEDAELNEDAESNIEFSEPTEELGREDYAHTFAKAS